MVQQVKALAMHKPRYTHMHAYTHGWRRKKTDFKKSKILKQNSLASSQHLHQYFFSTLETIEKSGAGPGRGLSGQKLQKTQACPQKVSTIQSSSSGYPSALCGQGTHVPHEHSIVRHAKSVNLFLNWKVKTCKHCHLSYFSNQDFLWFKLIFSSIILYTGELGAVCFCDS